MTAEVISFRGEAIGAGVTLNPSTVLEEAKGEDVIQVVVISQTADGTVHVYGSHGDAETFWLMKHGEVSMLRAATE